MRDKPNVNTTLEQSLAAAAESARQRGEVIANETPEQRKVRCAAEVEGLRPEPTLPDPEPPPRWKIADPKRDSQVKNYLFSYCLARRAEGQEFFQTLQEIREQNRRFGKPPFEDSSLVAVANNAYDRWRPPPDDEEDALSDDFLKRFLKALAVRPAFARAVDRALAKHRIWRSRR